MVGHALAVLARPPGSSSIRRAAVLSGVPDGDPLLGTVLADRYFLRRLIGEGAMGRVYEGHHTGIGKRVAIKIPRQSQRRKREMVQRFRLEAQAASQIRHPNIADVTDCGTTSDGRFFFVMEFIDGIDLVQLVRQQDSIAVERALLIAVQVSRALEAAHKAGIIHRDLKPSNVMLLRDRPHEDADFVKVLDFGVAKFLRADPAQHGGQLTQGDAAVGTPKYMAPEQIERGNEIDFRVDIYAVGGLLYFMLSAGHPPTEGDSVEAVWRKKMTEESLPLRRWRPDLSPAIEALVARCLARDPAGRPASMEVLRRDLLAAIEALRSVGLTALPHAPSVTSLVDSADRRSQRRNRAAMLLLGIGGSVAGLTALLVDRAMGPDKPPGPPSTAATHLPAPAGEPGSPPDEEPAKAAGSAGKTGGIGPAYGPPAPGMAARPRTTVVADKPAPFTAARPAPRASRPRRADRRRAGTAKSEPGSLVATSAPAFRATIAETLLAQGESSFQEADFEAAKKLAEKAIKEGAGVDGWLLLGKIHRATQDFPAAASAYDKALQVSPTDRRAREGLRRTADEQAAKIAEDRARPADN
jgi:serine/threonine protein kinase